MFERWSIAATAIVALTTGAYAADAPLAPAPVLARRPAVDGVNAKLEGFAGWTDWRGLSNRSNFSGGWLGSVSAPLGAQFGVQADVITASHRDALRGGGGGHLFWRDPGLGLIGGYGTVVHNDWLNDTRFRVGAEAAYYFGKGTVTGVAGYEEGSATNFANATFIAPGVVGFQFLPNRGRFFDMIDFSVYATQNIRVSVGHRYIGGRHAAAMGGEMKVWNFDNAAVAAFVEGRVGEGDYKAAWAGLRIYLGQSDKTLMARHREDDPPNWLKDDMFATDNMRRTGAAVLAPPAAPPPPPPPGT